MVQNKGRKFGVKVATYKVDGERYVGQIDGQRQTVYPFVSLKPRLPMASWH
jgi:hypothetical protein